MDIFAHTLWTNALSREAKQITKRKNKKLLLNVGWATFWGIFPDLFAFTIPFIIRFYLLLVGNVAFASMWGRKAVEGGGVSNGFDLAHNLYQYSHSIIIWLLAFILVGVLSKRPRYELFGWLLHILIDIPSHSVSFYPTPFLFPISTYVFPYGVSWGNMWYMIINYSALLLVWGRIFWKKNHLK